MLKLMKTLQKDERGFTLVELMVVVVIIGILVAVAIPVYGAVQTNAANRAHASNCRVLIGAAQMYIAEVGLTTAAENVDEDSGEHLGDYVEAWPTVPDRADATPEEFGAAVSGDPIPGTEQEYLVTINDDESPQVVISLSPDSAE